MIYELLLIQEGGIYIPRDIFVRRDGRTGSTAYECLSCGLISPSSHGSKQHIVEHHPRVRPTSFHPLRVLLPGLSVSLLQTCHIIRLEASPILYSRNSFHFNDPATASNFRWGTDCAQAKATQEIGIKKMLRCTPLETWVAYFTKRTLSLGQEFPHLRRMTIDLQFSWGCESADLLRSMSEGLRQRHQRLEWVLVLAFGAEEVLDCFKPLVDGANASDNGKKEVRQHVWPVMSGSVWKNSILWWGSPGEVVPQKYRLIKRQPRLR